MRRLFSFALGLGLGVTLALLFVRALRKARRRVPRAIADEARSWFASVRDTLSEALEEGRSAMEKKEAELRPGADASRL